MKPVKKETRKEKPVEIQKVSCKRCKYRSHCGIVNELITCEMYREGK